MKNRSKVLSVLLIMLTAAAFIPSCGNDASAAITSPRLVSKVTIYSRDYGSDELAWEESQRYEYEYKDAYPVSLSFTEDGNITDTSFEYEFKDGLPVSMTCKKSGSEDTVRTSYTKKGLVNRVRSYDETGRKFGEQIFTYGNRDEYFTMVLHENIISGPEDPVADHMEEVDSVMITSEDGLLRKTVNDGIFANYNDEEEKIWNRFDGSYTAKYDNNGIVESTSAKFKTFPGSGNQLKFDVTVTDGKAAEVILNNWAPADNSSDESASAESSEGTWEPDKKFVFEYTDDEISNSRYASMINYFLLEGGGNYYIYNWY